MMGPFPDLRLSVFESLELVDIRKSCVPTTLIITGFLYGSAPDRCRGIHRTRLWDLKVGPLVELHLADYSTPDWCRTALFIDQKVFHLV